MRSLILVALIACTTTTNSTTGDDDDDGGCHEIAGTWKMSGVCGDDSCTILQTGCSLTQLTCVSGSRSTSGTITGDGFSYRGFGPTGLPSTCTGTLAGDSMSGTCTVDGGGSCAFTGRRQ